MSGAVGCGRVRCGARYGRCVTIATDGPYADFLRFELAVFGEELFLPGYDPHLIRYGEYRFVCDHLDPRPGLRILDVGCEANIFQVFAASRGAHVVGIDVDPGAEGPLRERERLAQLALERPIRVEFQAVDATAFRPAGKLFDVVIAVSSIEHFFVADGHGDSLAMDTIACAVRPGGLALVTVPMSNGGVFFEVASGDDRFGYSYRLYTPEVLQERLCSHPELELVDRRFLAQSTPDPRFEPLRFIRFWQDLEADARRQWGFAHPLLAEMFNPAISETEARARPLCVNTALLAFRRC